MANVQIFDCSTGVFTEREETPEEVSAREAGYPALIEDTFNMLRLTRNGRLSQSDWTQVPDAPLSVEQKEEWKVYRQALRDLPQNTLDPFDVAWPTPPSSA